MFLQDHIGRGVVPVMGTISSQQDGVARARNTTTLLVGSSLARMRLGRRSNSSFLGYRSHVQQLIRATVALLKQDLVFVHHSDFPRHSLLDRVTYGYIVLSNKPRRGGLHANKCLNGFPNTINAQGSYQM